MLCRIFRSPLSNDASNGCGGNCWFRLLILRKKGAKGMLLLRRSAAARVRVDGALRQVTLPVAISVDGAETLIAAGRLGLGLIRAPRYHLESDLKSGTLVPVLAAFPPSPTPVSLLYPRSGQLSPRVRVFIDWLVRAFSTSRG
jgi:DNA-binding transcriptional LysR family regulator